ncbi:peptide/nickel transport system permease protein [Kaistia soli DSM 19436]|uniref:Peptide/nickel transport system permease protein n=1 Tax=Kaistia soli DSM 19436 TaxID=1122133 RepID=A0A1M5E2A5_9HYPH|nr:ABC transporter permease [Kaistia soli]SHF73300.1 peptide/nickel transport system permease protein [Kaistia soli DSM 19436]
MFSILRDLLRFNVEFLIGFLLTGTIFLFAAAHFFAPYPDTAIYLLPPDMPPSAEFWLGTTSRGQDVFWQISGAIWNTMTFGLTVMILSRIVALAVGMVSGYLGGKADEVLMTINDTLIALPNIPILLLVYFVMRDQMTWPLLALTAALLGWNYDARLIRSVTLSLRNREFTRHAVFAGMSVPQVLIRQHLPYVMPVVFFTAMNNLIWAIGLEVTLSVLGFSDVNRPTVGGMIYWANQHQAAVSGIWWWLVFPIVAVVLLFLGLFLLAISINEYIDPRSRLSRMGG